MDTPWHTGGTPRDAAGSGMFLVSVDGARCRSSPRRMLPCFASRTRSLLRSLSSRISVSLNDDQLWKRVVMRASRQSVASRSWSRSSVVRFSGRCLITTTRSTVRPCRAAPCWDKLRVTCIEASLSAALGAMARRSERKESVGNPHGSCRSIARFRPESRPAPQTPAYRGAVATTSYRQREPGSRPRQTHVGSTAEKFSGKKHTSPRREFPVTGLVRPSPEASAIALARRL
jgi:hypothetical protein